MDGRTEDKAIGRQGLAPEFIDDVIEDAAADVPTFVTGNTAADGLLANPERFGFNAQTFQGPAYSCNAV